MDVAAGEDDDHVSCLITRVFEAKANHGRLTILLLHGLKGEVIGVGHIGLRIARCFLLVRHRSLLRSRLESIVVVVASDGGGPACLLSGVAADSEAAMIKHTLGLYASQTGTVQPYISIAPGPDSMVIILIRAMCG